MFYQWAWHLPGDAKSLQTKLCSYCGTEEPHIKADQLAADVQQVLAHAEKPLPSLTPFRKTGNRAAALRSSWSHPLSVSALLASAVITPCVWSPPSYVYIKPSANQQRHARLRVGPDHG